MGRTRTIYIPDALVDEVEQTAKSLGQSVSEYLMKLHVKYKQGSTRKKGAGR